MTDIDAMLAKLEHDSTITFAELERMNIPPQKKTAIQNTRIAGIHDRWIGDRAQRRERARLPEAEAKVYAQACIDFDFVLANNRRLQRVSADHIRQNVELHAALAQATGQREAARAEVKALREELAQLRGDKKIELATEADLRRIERGTGR